MKNIRLNYFIKVITVILLGVLSRKISVIPLFVGDILYAVMIYFGVRMLNPKTHNSTSLMVSLLLCFAIEFFQLYQSEWIVEIRRTFLGHYILGQGFLWSDLAAYSVGVLLALFLDKKFSAQNHLSY